MVRAIATYLKANERRQHIRLIFYEHNWVHTEYKYSTHHNIKLNKIRIKTHESSFQLLIKKCSETNQKPTKQLI